MYKKAKTECDVDGVCTSSVNPPASVDNCISEWTHLHLSQKTCVCISEWTHCQHLRVKDLCLLKMIHR